jgi:hypothetical protein
VSHGEERGQGSGTRPYVGQSDACEVAIRGWSDDIFNAYGRSQQGQDLGPTLISLLLGGLAACFLASNGAWEAGCLPIRYGNKVQLRSSPRNQLLRLANKVISTVVDICDSID